MYEGLYPTQDTKYGDGVEGRIVHGEVADVFGWLAKVSLG